MYFQEPDPQNSPPFTSQEEEWQPSSDDLSDDLDDRPQELPDAQPPDPEDPDRIEDTQNEGPDRRSWTIRRKVGSRLDVYLQQRLKGISRSRVQKLIDLGAVKVNQRPPKASTVIHLNDQIEVLLPRQAVRRIRPEPIPIDVLYEDPHMLVLNKQAGVIVHPARSHLSGTLLNGLAYRFHQQLAQAGLSAQHRQTRGFRRTDTAARPTQPREDGAVAGLSAVGAQEFRPGIIHRLDKNTTGVLVIAKTDDAHWAIARQFEDRSTLKAYLALVHGNIAPPGGVIDFPIGKHPTVHEAFAVRHDRLAKPAVTLYRVRRQYPGFCLVELELKTGRTHQIRVHLSYLGHPVVGDILYGGEPVGQQELLAPPLAAGSRKFHVFAREKDLGLKIESDALKRPDLILAHPALHAALLQIQHPHSRQPIQFTAPLHQPMAGLVHQLEPRRVNLPVATEGYWVDLTAALTPAQ